MKIKALAIFFAFFSSFLMVTVGFGDTVCAETDWLPLCNFDDIATGVESGTSGYFDFTNVGTANSCEPHTDYDLSAPNSYKVKCIEGYDIDAYWNLTNDIDYIGAINFSFYTATFLAGASWYMKFYDSDDNEVIRLKWSDTNGVQWNGVGGTTDLLGWAAIEDDRQYMVITHNGTNNFNVKILTDAFAVEKNVDVAGKYAGTWTNFSYIHFCDETVDADCETSVYFDDFYISSSSSVFDEINIRFYDMYSGEQIPYINPSFVGPIVSGAEYIDFSSVHINDYVYPNFMIADSSCDACYYITVDVSGDGFVDGEEVTINIPNVYVRDHIDQIVRLYNEYTANFTIYDGVTLNVFLTPQSTADGPPLEGEPTDAVLTTYKGIYGNEFIEFWQGDDGVIDTCRYRVGAYPYIIYNLSDANFSDENGYLFEIIHADSFWHLVAGTTWYSGIINFPGSDINYVARVPRILTSTGIYQIRLYNFTTNQTKDSLVYLSSPMTVCESEGTVDEDEDFEDDTDDYLPLVDSDDYTFLIGIMACLCVATFVGYVTLSGNAFGFGFFGSMLFFSIPDQIFTLLPPSVMAVSAFVMVLIMMYMLFRR